MATINDISDVRAETDGWIVSVKHVPWVDTVEVWFAHRGNKIEICYFDDRGRMLFKELKEGAIDPPPTMRINRSIWEGIVKSINGFQEIPEKQSVDAELKATKYHLEDMRSLMKLKK